MELSLLILVCIHKSYIVYLEINVVPIGHGFSFLVMEKSWKINVEKEGYPGVENDGNKNNLVRIQNTSDCYHWLAEIRECFWKAVKRWKKLRGRPRKIIAPDYTCGVRTRDFWKIRAMQSMPHARVIFVLSKWTFRWRLSTVLYASSCVDVSWFLKSETACMQLLMNLNLCSAFICVRHYAPPWFSGCV